MLAVHLQSSVQFSIVGPVARQLIANGSLTTRSVCHCVRLILSDSVSALVLLTSNLQSIPSIRPSTRFGRKLMESWTLHHALADCRRNASPGGGWLHACFCLIEQDGTLSQVVSVSSLNLFFGNLYLCVLFGMSLSSRLSDCLLSRSFFRFLCCSLPLSLSLSLSLSLTHANSFTRCVTLAQPVRTARLTSPCPCHDIMVIMIP